MRRIYILPLTRRLYGWILSLLMVGSFGACSVEDEYTSSALDNYNALWEILDKRYSYFDLKLPSDSSWRDMYYKHLPKIRQGMTTDSLFLVMTQLMAELKDGHVNLSTPFDYGRYWQWYQDYPANYSGSLVSRYLGDDYRIAGGLRYTRIQYGGHEADSIGYLRLASFSSGLSHSNVSAALSRLTACKALIIDIRDNGGGNVTTSDLFARHFVRDERVVGYSRYKTGAGHNDFSELQSLTLKPLETGTKWFRPVVLLTNRAVYSAANDFTLRMKHNPFVTVMGDRTGGGGGLPMTSELPNGWSLRYSSTQTFDTDLQHIEHGIEPHYYVSLKPEDVARGRDTLIEEAITYLLVKLDYYRQMKVWEK